MDLISKKKLIKNLVNHPYESNPEYFAKVNMFYYSQDGKFAAGYWEAPQGWFDAVVEGFNEIDFIIEGEIEAISKDENRTVVVKPGDCFLIKNGDKFKWKISKFTKAVFFLYPLTEELRDFFKSLIV